MFCALGPIFGGTEGDRSRFHVLRPRSRFRRCRVLGPVFMFCALVLIFGGTEGVGSCFHVLRVVLVFGGTKGIGSRFNVLRTELIFGGTKGVGSRFQVLRSRSRFQRFRGRRFPFSCLACPYSFSVVPRASGPVFMFCAPELIFGDIEGIGSRFLVLRGRTFSAALRVSGPVFMFCALELIFGDVEFVGSRFHVLRARSRFQRYRGCGVSFSCFALPDSFSAVPRASGPFFMFFASGLVLGGTEGVSALFHVLRSQTRFRLYRGCQVPFSCFTLRD
jgi:hypothetical protein